jgi:hypothetical protein
MRMIRSNVAAALAALLVAGGAYAKVTPEEAARLSKDLTPTGAERAGTKDGSIPAWTGGLAKAPACFVAGKRYCDPFASDKPLFTITASNADQHKERLSAGQLAMFRKFPTYKMDVYPTRRTLALPDYAYEATRQNALNAELGGDGDALKGAAIGIPFPIPKSGHEPIWNHKLRYRGIGGRRFNNQFAVTTSGDYNAVTLREDFQLAYARKTATPDNLNNISIYFLQVVTQPPRLAGQILLVHETIDQVSDPRHAWQYNPGQRRLRRAPNVGYDNPGTAADGLRTNDQTDTFNGAMDRYTWKIVGKKEMYIPYNSYRLSSGDYKYADIVRKDFLNQDLPRYEKHRCWVVDSELKPGTSHIYKRRTFYIDEDSWAMGLVDIYDNRDQLWRWQEAHPLMLYDKPYPGVTAETVYDLLNNRYLVQALSNEAEEFVEQEFPANYFDPANVSSQAIR